MPVYLENLNLGFFRESEDSYMSLMGFIASEGKGISGYYNLPYFNLHFGSAQMILRTSRKTSDTGDENHLQSEGLDTHTAGHRVWKVRVHEMNIDKNDSDLLSKRIAVNRLNGNGMAVVNLVNADVLPSYMKDDVIKIQMVAFPDAIEYYKDEDDYAAHQPDGKDGKKWLIGEGSVFPTGMLRNRVPDSDEFESNDDLDGLTAVRGIVKALYWGNLEFNGESHNAYIKCIIDTDFGELEIVHTVDQVSEELRDNMKVGATVVMYGILSGDVAIYEYEKGIIRDENNNLAAMRYMFSGNDPERIRSILADDVEYLSQSGENFSGIDAVIDRIKYVQHENKNKYFAHYAKIMSIDDGADELDYSVDKRCLVLAFEDETNYESIVFFDYNENGYISRIVTSTNPRYHFAIQNPSFEDDDESDNET